MHAVPEKGAQQEYNLMCTTEISDADCSAPSQKVTQFLLNHRPHTDLRRCSHLQTVVLPGEPDQ